VLQLQRSCSTLLRRLHILARPRVFHTRQSKLYLEV
jgi:hypothetical protein